MAKIKGNIVELDVKDKRILSELDFNARIPISKLSKKVGLSEEVVNYRMKILTNLGVIKRFYTVIDIYRIGYIYTRIFIRLKKIFPKHEKELIKYIQKINSIGWLIYGDGVYDLTIGIYSKSVDEIESVYSDLRFKYGNLFLNREFTIGSKVHHFKNNVLYDTIDHSTIIFGEKKENIIIDPFDKGIINILSSNARTPLIEIAKKLKLTPNSIKYRIKNLENKKIILGYKTQIDEKKLDYEHFKIFVNFNKLNKSILDKMITFLQLDKNVIYITQPIGKSFLEFEVLVKDRVELYEKMEDIRNKFPTNIEDFFVILHYEELSTNFKLM